MTSDSEFTTGRIHAIECLKEAWTSINDEYWILFAVSLVGVMVAGISVYLLIGAMVCGILKCYLKKIDGKRVEFADLWLGFKYFRTSLLVTIAIVVPIVGLAVVMFVTVYLPVITAAVMGNRANDNALLGSLLAGLAIDIVLAVIMVCIHSLLIFSFPLIVDRGMSSWGSMKMSAHAVMKNLGGIGGMIGVNLLLALAGYAVCGIGLYLVIPLITATNLVAYRRVFPPYIESPE